MARDMNERTNERTNDVMSAPAHIAQTLVDLRARRQYLDDAIHVLSSIWETPAAAPTAAYVAVAEPAPAPAPRKQLKAARSSHPPKPDRRTTPRRRSDDGLLTADAEAVLRFLRGSKAPMKPSDVLERLKFDKRRGMKAKGILQRRNLITVTGTARASRWSVSTSGSAPAKEEP